jgi:urease accessory protein
MIRLDSEKIPEEFAQYLQNNSDIEKASNLQITLAMDVAKNKTVIIHQYSKAPLLTQKALHYDVANPAMAYLFLMSSSGGILQGDRHHIQMSVQKNAIANVTTHGATRIYKMESNYAAQFIDITVGDNAYLEFLPDQIIPYKKSRYFQQVQITAGADSTLVYSEIVMPGRVAMGELFDYDLCYLKMVAKNKNGKILFMDSLKLDPKHEFSRTGILGTKSVFGTIYILTKKEQLQKISDEINSVLENSDLTSGCSFLPEDCGLVVKILGDLSEDIKTLMHQCVRVVRKHVLDSSFAELRKT